MLRNQCHLVAVALPVCQQLGMFRLGVSAIDGWFDEFNLSNGYRVESIQFVECNIYRIHFLIDGYWVSIFI